MKLFYIVPIVIGFGIDLIDFGKWAIAYIKRKDIPSPSFDTFSVFFLPAWGISGLMYFGKPPQEVMKIWDLFITVLFLAFCVHLFIRFALPFIVIAMCNLYYRRNLFDKNPLPPIQSKRNIPKSNSRPLHMDSDKKNVIPN